MHGIAFAELQRYISEKTSGDVWAEVRTKAGAGKRRYLATRSYTDQEFMALLGAACEVTGWQPSVLLCELGQFIVPMLARIYHLLIEPEWKTLDLIEHTEESIHRAVRARSPGANPPALNTTRTGPDEVVIVYSSPLKLCSLAKGIVKGVAALYGEEVLLSEKSCMLEGSAHCELTVRIV